MFESDEKLYLPPPGIHKITVASAQCQIIVRLLNVLVFSIIFFSEKEFLPSVYLDIDVREGDENVDLIH